MGYITATTIYFKIKIHQNIDDQGIFTDLDYVDEIINWNFNPFQLKYTGYTSTQHNMVFGLTTIPFNDRIFLRLNNSIAADYYTIPAYWPFIQALTDSKLFSVKGYDDNNPYQLGINFGTILQPTQYLGYDSYLDADQYIIDGLLNYLTYRSDTRYVYNSDIDQYVEIPLTYVSYQGHGWNADNTSLSALTKEEKYFGIVFPPEVKNNVFIDRGKVAVFNTMARLGDIGNMFDLEIYGNKFYDIIN